MDSVQFYLFWFLQLECCLALIFQML